MHLPKWLTTVTPVSKMLALAMLVVLPVLAFFFGTSYQKLQQTSESSPLVSIEYLIGNTITVFNKNNVLWISDRKGASKELRALKKEELPPIKKQERFFVSSNNQYIVWFSAMNVWRYNILNNTTEKLDTFSQAIMLSSFYKDIAQDADTLYYLNYPDQTFIRLHILTGKKEVVQLPKQFTTFSLSPDSTKVLLGREHGGSARESRHSIMEVDGTNYIDLPVSFDQGNIFVRVWSIDGSAIYQVRMLMGQKQQLVSFDTTTGKEIKVATVATVEQGIEECSYMGEDLLCTIRDFRTQESARHMIVDGQFVRTNAR